MTKKEISDLYDYIGEEDLNKLIKEHGSMEAAIQALMKAGEEHPATCMCIECLPTPKENHANDSQTDDEASTETNSEWVSVESNSPCIVNRNRD